MTIHPAYVTRALETMALLLNHSQSSPKLQFKAAAKILTYAEAFGISKEGTPEYVPKSAKFVEPTASRQCA